MQFPKQAFSVGQQLVFQFLDKKMLMLTVKEMEGLCNIWIIDYYIHLYT